MAFEKAKQLWDLQKRARAIQKELRDTEVEASSADGRVTVVFNGEMHLKSISVDPSLAAEGQKHVLEEAVKNTVTQALARAQAIAAEKSKELMGNMGMNIPGM